MPTEKSDAQLTAFVYRATDVIPTVDIHVVDRATGMVDYECPGCGTTRHLDRARWDALRASQRALRCLACDTVYRLPPQ